MQLDKNAINNLLSQDDDKLWQIIRVIAAQAGAQLPDKASADELSVIRRALSGADNLDVEKALKILQRYKSE